jgi:MoaA/NifB/PqqE/SkfB family radical SAM enzyme
MLARNGVKMVSITGGEPLLHPRFLDLCRAVHDREMTVSYIATNGTLLDDQTARGLSRLDVNIVGLSMDRFDGNGFGLTRRYNVRKAVVRAKGLLDRYGISSYAGVLPGRTPEELRAVLARCAGLGFSRVVVSYPQCRMGSSYRAAADGPDTALDAVALGDIIGALRAEKRNGHGLSFFNTEVNLDELAKAAGGRRTAFDCPAGKWQFYLDWELDVYRCFNDGLRLGNALEMDGLDFECRACDGCTQQSYLDYASFFRAYEFVNGLRTGILGADGARLGRLLSDQENFRAMRSVMEVWLGGFL